MLCDLSRDHGEPSLPRTPEVGDTGARWVESETALVIEIENLLSVIEAEGQVMPKCPICKTSLETVRQREGLYYPCRSCHGRAVTVPQIRHVLGERVAMKLLRLMRLNPRLSAHGCPFCDKPMLVVNSEEPQMEVEVCKSCNAAWFDEPTYECLPELASDTTNSMQMQMTEVLALDHLEELKKRMEEERKAAQKKKRPLHRIFDPEKDGHSETPGR